MNINERIGRRLAQLRDERGLTLRALADRSQVSCAMIARIERAESSATATVLNKLSVGLGVVLPELFGPGGYREPRLKLHNPVASRKGQPEWVDPVSGYRRRTLSPSTTPPCRCRMRLHEILFPPGAKVIFENAGGAAQQIWLLRGQLEVRSGLEITMLMAGDCMAVAHDGAFTVHNPGDKDARYLVALAQPA